METLNLTAPTTNELKDLKKGDSVIVRQVKHNKFDHVKNYDTYYTGTVTKIAAHRITVVWGHSGGIETKFDRANGEEAENRYGYGRPVLHLDTQPNRDMIQMIARHNGMIDHNRQQIEGIANLAKDLKGSVGYGSLAPSPELTNALLVIQRELEAIRTPKRVDPQVAEAVAAISDIEIQLSEIKHELRTTEETINPELINGLQFVYQTMNDIEL